MRNYGKFKIADTPKSKDTLAYLNPDIGRISGFYRPFISKDSGSVVFAIAGKFGIQQISRLHQSPMLMLPVLVHGMAISLPQSNTNVCLEDITVFWSMLVQRQTRQCSGFNLARNVGRIIQTAVTAIRHIPMRRALAYTAAGADGGPFGPVSADPDNPVARWNYIYVPTCDGSFHFGDAAADYDDDGMPDHFHNGLRQTSAAVSLMKQLFPNSRKILIAGSSNGGYGTFGATPIVRLAFPDARLYVLNDSGPGLFRPEEPALWPVLIKTWNLSSMLPTNCQQCQNQLIYLFDWMLDYDSKLKIGMYTSYQDAVVSQVVGMSGAENEQLLRTTTTQIHQNHPDTFKRYFIQGDSHCIADFYNQVNGVTVWMWLDAFINDRPGWDEILE